MDSLNPEHPPVVVARVGRRPLVWKFWGTVLWGLFIFAAMFIGQIAVVAWFVLRQGGPIDVAIAVHVVGGGITISLSVICGLPAVLAALWLAIHLSRTPFADYLALRGTSWKGGWCPALIGHPPSNVDSLGRTHDPYRPGDSRW